MGSGSSGSEVGAGSVSVSGSVEAGLSVCATVPQATKVKLKRVKKANKYSRYIGTLVSKFIQVSKLGVF